MPTTALITGGLGAAGAIGSSFLQSNAATNAAQAQLGFGQQALSTLSSMGQQGLSTLQDFWKQAQGIGSGAIDTGKSLLSTMGGLIDSGLARGTGVINKGLDLGEGVLATGLGTGTGILDTGMGLAGSTARTLTDLLNPGKASSVLSQLPGFQFAQEWGQRAVENLGTTTGLGGNTLTAGANYATGLASQTWDKLLSQLQGGLTGGTGLVNAGTGFAGTLGGLGSNIMTGLGGLGSSLMTGIGGLGTTIGGMGSSLLGGTIGSLISGGLGAGSSALSGLLNLGQNMGGLYGNMGGYTASGTLGSANALAGGLTGATSAGSNAAMLFGIGNLLKGNNALPGLTGA